MGRGVIMKINKVTSAIAVTLLFTSAPTLAEVCEMQGQSRQEAYQHIPEGELETATGFQPISEWTGGTIITNNTDNLLIETPEGPVGAYRNGLAKWGQSGWGQLLLVDPTQSEQSRPWIAPDGYDGVYMFYDVWRHKHSDGINRIIPCINPGSSYEVSADAASKGTLVWSYSYFKTGEETITTVKSTTGVVTNNAWTSVNETFDIPFDIDVTKDFIITLATVGGDEEIHESDVAPIFADNFSLIEQPFESSVTEPTDAIPEDEIYAGTIFPSVWPNGTGYITDPGFDNSMTDLPMYKSAGNGIVMVVDPAFGNSGQWWNCAHFPGGIDNDYAVDRCLAINWRTTHDDGIARIIDNITPGGSYVFSVDGASHYPFVLSYAYTKLGESAVTRITLPGHVVSGRTWVNIEKEFTAPRDIDVTQPFKVIISTIDPDTSDLEGAVAQSNDERVIWANNFSLIEMPVGGDTDEDGVVDTADAFPENPAAAKDTDGDGMPDEFLASCEGACVTDSGLTLDDDDDNDGVLDIHDGYPLDDSKNILISIESATAIAGAEVMLDASASIPSMDVADTVYTWEQTVGSFDLAPSGQNLSFIPTVSDTKVEAEFRLTVDTPTQTYSELYPVTIYKTPATITPNLVITGRDESNGTTLVETRDPDTNEVIETIEYLNVMPGENIVLDASGATDSDGFTLTHNWEWTHTQWWLGVIVAEGTDPTTPTLSFTVPEWSENYPETFTLTLTNNEADIGDDSLENSVVTVPIYLNIVRQEVPKKIHSSTKDVGGGSFGYLAAMLLGGLSFFRRLIKTQK